MKKARNFAESIGYAWNGINYTFRTQRNARIHGVLAVGVLAGAWFFRISRTELLVLILTIMLVIALEIVNTAVETVVNLCTSDYHPVAEKAKNAAAGAVLLAAFGAVVEGIIIFGPKAYGFLFFTNR